MSLRPISVTPIGEVYTATPDDQIGRLRKRLISEIKIYSQYVEATEGLELYSHIFVLFWMDKLKSTGNLTCHPRGKRDITKVGVLSARGRNHPNPIGLAVCELIEIHQGVLTVRKLDAYNGSKVIDIKPYDDYDQVANLKLPPWLRDLRT